MQQHMSGHKECQDMRQSPLGFSPLQLHQRAQLSSSSAGSSPDPSRIILCGDLKSVMPVAVSEPRGLGGSYSSVGPSMSKDPTNEPTRRDMAFVVGASRSRVEGTWDIRPCSTPAQFIVALLQTFCLGRELKKKKCDWQACTPDK